MSVLTHQSSAWQDIEFARDYKSSAWQDRESFNAYNETTKAWEEKWANAINYAISTSYYNGTPIIKVTQKNSIAVATSSYLTTPVLNINCNTLGVSNSITLQKLMSNTKLTFSISDKSNFSYDNVLYYSLSLVRSSPSYGTSTILLPMQAVRNSSGKDIAITPAVTGSSFSLSVNPATSSVTINPATITLQDFYKKTLDIYSTSYLRVGIYMNYTMPTYYTNPTNPTITSTVTSVAGMTNAYSSSSLSKATFNFSKITIGDKNVNFVSA